MAATANSISINGGQGQYPIGFIDTDRGLECSFTNAMFDGDMFEIANATQAEDGETSTFETKKYAVASGLTVELPFEVEATSVYIRGLTATTAEAAAGSFKVTVAEGKTTLTFAEGDVAVGDELHISYERVIENAHTIKITTTTASARGEVWMHWPVYSSGTDLNVRSFAA